MIADFKDLDNAKRYKVMSSSVIPRPIAWITTEDNGVINVAPFSYFTPLSSDPATILVSIGHKPNGEQKDTLFNILKNKKATINFVNAENFQAMEKSATSLPKEQSEADEYDIAVRSIKDGYPPMVESSQLALFCDFYQKIEMPGVTVPVILEIKSLYGDDSIMDKDFNIVLENIGRLGGTYAKMTSI